MSDLESLGDARKRQATRTDLSALELDELLHMDIPPRQYLLAPIISAKGLLMVHAKRGIGKTYFALSIAHAVATGTKFMRWTSTAPRRVLYVDGEMPLTALQARLKGITSGSAATAPVGNFRLLAADYHEDGIPNLASSTGQEAIEPHLDGADLLVIDNLSTLAGTVRDNDADSWSEMQSWLLRLRRRGIAVILVHHSGKGGAQRGTSRREDSRETVIALKRPEDYSPTEGARFEVHFENSRGFYGRDAEPFETRLLMVNGNEVQWTVSDIRDIRTDQVVSLNASGKSLREIEEETGISKSAAQRIVSAAKSNGSAASEQQH